MILHNECTYESVPIFVSIVHGFVCSRINYCNSVQYWSVFLRPGYHPSNCRLLNAAARLIARLSRYSHNTLLQEINISTSFQSLLTLNKKHSFFPQRTTEGGTGPLQP